MYINKQVFPSLNYFPFHSNSNLSLFTNQVIGTSHGLPWADSCRSGIILMGSGVQLFIQIPSGWMQLEFWISGSWKCSGMLRHRSYKADPRPQLGKPLIFKKASTIKLSWWGLTQSFLISQLLGFCSWRWGPEGLWLSSRLCTEQAWPQGPYQSHRSFILLRTILQPGTHLMTGSCMPGTVLGAVREVREKRSLCISQLRLLSQMPQLGDIKQAYFLSFLELQDQVSAGLAPFMDLQPSFPVSSCSPRPAPHAFFWNL